MKKKSILNRPMFRQVKSPAYGTGIASNLVSNEERQRYNSGGRVGLAYGQPWQAFKWDQPPGFQEIWKGSKNVGTWQDTQKAKSNLNRMLEYAEPFGEWTGSVRQSPQYIDSEEGLPLQYGVKISGVGDDVEAQDVYQGSDPRYFKPRHQGVFVEETDVRENQPYNQDDIIDDSVTEETPTPSERQPGWDLTEDSYSNFLKGRKKITPEGYEGVIDTDLMSDEINIDFENKKQKAKDLAKTLALFKGAEIAGNVFSQPTKAKMLGALGKGIGELGPTVTKPLADVRKTEDVFEMQKALLREKGMEAQKKQILSDKNRFNMLIKANEWNKDLQKEMANLDFQNKKALKELDPEGKLTKSETFLALVSKDPSATNKASVLNILTDRGTTVFDTKNGTQAPKNMRQGDIVIDAQRKTIFVADENGVLQPASLAEFGINVEETFADN
jgi:hypothetical protein